MNKQLEKAMLDGKTRLVDCEYLDVMYLYNKYFFNFRPDFFSRQIHGCYSAQQAKETDENDLKILNKGIITNDGAIYPVYDLVRSKSAWLKENHINNHVISSAWLRLNGIDLSNSVRYALYNKGLEFYPCHDSYKRLENIEDIDSLIKTYVEIYEKSIEENHVLALSLAQIKSMAKVANSLNENVISAMMKTNCFGLTKRLDQFEDYSDYKNSKYNRLYLKDVCNFDKDNSLFNYRDL